jgi:tetratricopeptide (TPR) repeat protein
MTDRQSQPDVSAQRLTTAISAAYNAGEMEQVIALATQAGESGQTNEFIQLLLGMAQQASQLYSASTATFLQLTVQHPAVSAYWNNLALAQQQLGDVAACELAFQTARSLAPDDAEILYNLGLLLISERRWPEARETLMDAVHINPDFIEARLQAAHACYTCGDNSGQEAMLAGAAEWPAQPADQAMILADMLSVQGDTEVALHALAMAVLPEASEAGAVRLRLAAHRVALYERSNQLILARDALLQLPLNLLDGLPREDVRTRSACWSAHAALALRDGRHAEAADLYRHVLAVAADEESLASANFGLAQACDRQTRYVEAWQAAEGAHAAQLEIAREIVPELLAADSKPLQMADRVVRHVQYAGWTSLPAPQGRQNPVFVVGFPRSGTTLLEQMLDAHPDFRSMDERAFIHELTERMEMVGQHYPADLANLTRTDTDQLRAVYARMVGKVLPDLGGKRLVDKNPLNMLCLPMIMRLFPAAPIILCLRHPCDVLLSCYLQPFRSPAYMVMCSSLQRLAEGYVQAFEQWQKHIQVFKPHLLEWRYESVVGDFDANVASLGKFLELEDASPMVRFAEHARGKRFISTPSYAQVTQGISNKAVNRWHAYRDMFEPVLPILRPIMQRLGYAE